MTSIQKALYKSISYRLISVTITFVISYYITGDVAVATAIMSADALIKMIVYFYHERLWRLIYKKANKKKWRKRERKTRSRY